MLTIGSLFSGIGGLELGLEWSGLGPTLWQVEQSEFCRKVLTRHWPDALRFDDVRTVGAELPPVDLICGGFPCQDISSAGKGAGLAGERSGLWREFARIVDAARPEWVVVENVASGAKRWVDAVAGELGQLGYEVLPVPLSAADVGAPHLRRRVFLVAHTHRQGQPAQPEHAEMGGVSEASRHDSDHDRIPGGSRNPWQRAQVDGVGDGAFEWSTPVSPVCGVDDGFPHRMERLRALGNAVVPQCAEVVGWVIRELAGLTP